VIDSGVLNMGKGSFSKSVQRAKDRFNKWNRPVDAKRAKAASRVVKSSLGVAGKDVSSNFRKNYLTYAAIARNAGAEYAINGGSITKAVINPLAVASTLVGEEGYRQMKKKHPKLAKAIRIGGRALPYVYEAARIARMASLYTAEGALITAGDLTANPVALAATGALAAGVVSQIGMNMQAAHQRKIEKKHDPVHLAEEQTRAWRRDSFHDMSNQGFKLDKKLSSKNQAVFSDADNHPIILQRDKRSNGDEIWGDISSTHVSKNAQKVIDQTYAKYHTASLGEYGRVVSNNPEFAKDHKNDAPTIDPYIPAKVYIPHD
jgi:hypothetical protein